MLESEVKLLRTWSSPFALRIVWALKLKGVKYETILEDLANKSPSLLQYNRVHKTFPVLIHGRNTVDLEYIDETWAAGHRLLPEDPYERSVTRFWAKFGDDQVFVLVWRAFTKQGEALILALKHLKFVEEYIKEKRFFGDEIGFTDLVFSCLANLLSILEEVTEVKILDPQTFPSLLAWIEVFSKVPVVKENWPPREKMIVKFKAICKYFLASK
uniref:glutathione transferase n=1 Tax=Kalanchoe fedtschenkoi TaxID=63787 RepID=A0A7N0V7Q7_KALFE